MSPAHYIKGTLFYRYSREAQQRTGYTMKEIKQKVKDQAGRLPRPGYEICAGLTKDGSHKIYLSNRAGTLEISTYPTDETRRQAAMKGITQ